MGSGGFGYVYSLRRESDNSIFALKTLPINFRDERTFKSFVNEANLAVRVKHRNVIEYIFFHDGSLFEDLPPYIIMEFADAGTLSKVIENQKEKGEFLSNEELEHYYLQLIEGMEAINSELIHRDIKPDNILIKDDLLKISDFGISKIIEEATRTSTFKGIGHIMYMSPEGWKMQPNSIQMDIYSMGIVFYELAVLKHPYEYLNLEDLEDWRDAHLFKNPEPLITLNTNLTPSIQQMILTMLDKKLTERFRNWNDVREVVEKDDLPVTKDTPLIENLLIKKLEQDAKLKEEILKKEKRKKEIEEHNKIVEYQFKNEFANPITDFISELNSRYEGKKISVEYKTPMGTNSYDLTIHFPSGNWVVLLIKALFEEEFYREKITRGFRGHGREIVTKEIDHPKFYDKKIMAWGIIKGSDNVGLNVILVERENELYGEWYVLTTTNNPIVRDRRYPEPFPLDLNGIEERIRNLRVMDIYQTKVMNLEINDIKEFIGKYF